MDGAAAPRDNWVSVPLLAQLMFHKLLGTWTEWKLSASRQVLTAPQSLTHLVSCFRGEVPRTEQWLPRQAKLIPIILVSLLYLKQMSISSLNVQLGVITWLPSQAMDACLLWVVLITENLDTAS